MNLKRLLQNKNSILNKGFASTLIKVLGALSSYGLSFLIARKFGAEGNGVFALFMTYTVILSTFFYLGLDFFLIKRVSVLMVESRFAEVQYLYRKILKSYITPASVLIILGGVLLAVRFDEILFFLGALGIVVNVFIDINSAVFRGMKMAEWFSFFTQFSKYFITIVLFLIPVLSEEGNKDSVIVPYLVSLLFNGGLSFYILRNKLGKLVIKDNTESIKTYSILSILKVSKDFFFASILIITLVWVDFILIDIFLSEEDAGIYSIALKLATLVSFGFTAFNAFLAPRISEIHAQGNIQKLQKVLTENYALVLPMLLLPFCGILFFHSELLGFFGTEFRTGWKVLLLLAMGQLINGIFGPVSLLLQMTNHQKLFQYILILTFAVKLILAYIFVNSWGIEGIAFASFLGLSVWTIVGSYFVYKKIGVYSWFSLGEVRKLLTQIRK